jgi:uncharacterized protein YecE (DUF72 family)
MELRIGCSGWSYDEWVGHLYPTRKTPKLRYYSSIFSTAEIDSTFYAYPKPETVHGWIRNTPVGFKFSAKLPQIITHTKRLENAEEDTLKFLELVRPLSDANKMGVVLVQLPPSFAIERFDTLENFFRTLPSDFRYAVEFRNKSWQDQRAWELLESYDISSVFTDSPLELQSRMTTDLAFIRYHGRGEKIWYDYRYSEEEMKKLAQEFQKISEQSKVLYAYFNNHYGANAVENALELIEQTGIPSPRQAEQMVKLRAKTADLNSFL